MNPSQMKPSVTTMTAMMAFALMLIGSDGDAQTLPSPAPSAPTQAAPAESARLRDGPGHQALVACRGDMVALCGGIEKGGGRRIDCLKDNRAKLSAGCQAAIQTVLDKGSGARLAPPALAAAAGPTPGAPGGAAQPVASPTPQVACRAEIQRLCAGVEKGQGRIMACLKSQKADLTPGCATAMFQRSRANQVINASLKQACSADAQRLCPGEKGPDKVTCLRDRHATLSPSCQQLLTPTKGN